MFEWCGVREYHSYHSFILTDAPQTDTSKLNVSVSAASAAATDDKIERSEETALSSIPEIRSTPLLTSTRRLVCIVTASDGLWDVISNEEATSLANQLLRSNVDPIGVADRLVREARSRGSKDDITCVVVDIQSYIQKAAFSCD